MYELYLIFVLNGLQGTAQQTYDTQVDCQFAANSLAEHIRADGGSVSVVLCNPKRSQ